MKKKNVLVIHRGYPLGVEAGDKIRTLNMVESLRRMGYNVVLLGFFTRGFSFLKEERKTLPKGLKSILLYSLPNRMRLAKLAEFIRAIETFVISKLYSIDVIQAELSASAPCARFVTDIPLITDFHSDLVPELQMGELKSDEKKAHTIIVKNVGKSNLEILDLQVFNSALGVQLKKRVLKPGASTKLKITAFGQNLKKVKGTPRVLMITNDPNNPKIIIKVKVTSKK